MGLDSPNHTKSGPSGGRFFLHDVIRRRDGIDKIRHVGQISERPIACVEMRRLMIVLARRAD